MAWGIKAGHDPKLEKKRPVDMPRRGGHRKGSGRKKLHKRRLVLKISHDAICRIYSKAVLSPDHAKLSLSEVVEQLAQTHLAPWTWDYDMRIKYPNRKR